MNEFDYLSPLRIPFKLFKVSGLWQDESASKLYKVYGFVHVVFGMGIFTLGQLIYFIKARSVMEASDVLSILFTYIGLLIKSITFIVKMQDIFDALKDYENMVATIKTMNKQPLRFLKARMTQASIIFGVLYGTCLITTIFGGIFPFVAFFLNPNPPYRIAYKVWAPFEIETSVPGFFAVAIIELLNSNFYCGVVSAVVILPVFFFNAASGLIDELSLQLTNIEKEFENQDDATKRLIECIEIHLKIKGFIKKAEKIFSPMMFAEASCSLVIFCTTSFLLSKISPFIETSVFIRLTSYMCPVVLIFLIPCYFGNEVSVTSEKLSASLFDSDWFKQTKKFHSATKMFMENTKKEVVINAAGGFFRVNLSGFLSVCNSAYSVYAVLQRIN